MTGVLSAGLLVHRMTADGPQFLLAHPGGPFWKNKDEAAWSIPKGLVEDGEDPEGAARREFEEEIGQRVSRSGVALEPCRVSGKTILAWLVEADLDVTIVRSNTFEIEWPPKSGRRAVFAEVDRAAYFDGPTALVKIHRGQRPLLVEAIERLRREPPKI